MGAVRPVQIALDKIQDVGAHTAVGGPGVGIAQQGEQRAVQPGARLELGEQEVLQRRLVHVDHFQRLGHLFRQAAGHAGGDDGALPGQKQPGQALGQVGRLPQALEEGLEVGVVAHRAGILAAVLLFGPPVGPHDLGGIRYILDLRIARRHRDISVRGRIIIPRDRICGT